jgi:hypothetical protein
MPDLPQRWLSLSGISTTLNLTPTQIKTLYNQKLLVRIGKRPQDYRYLDPTPEYAERLRLAAVMLSKNSQVNIDLPMTFLLTIREICEITGWSQRKTIRVLEEGKVPCFKSKNMARLYSVTTLREIIFKRQGRHFHKQVAPMLLPELVAFAKRFIDSEAAIVPTDEAFKADAELQKKMHWIMRQKSPQREVIMADLLAKLELAKKVLSAAQPRI